MCVAVTADGDNLAIYCHKIKGCTVIKDVVSAQSLLEMLMENRREDIFHNN